MFGIGIPEMLVIAAVALVFIGPDKLPGVLRSIGKGLVELKRSTSDVRSTVQSEMQKIEEEIELNEIRKTADDLNNEMGGITNKVKPLTLSKMNSDNQLEKMADMLDSTNNDEKIENKKIVKNKSKNDKTS